MDSERHSGTGKRRTSEKYKTRGNVKKHRGHTRGVSDEAPQVAVEAPQVANRGQGLTTPLGSISNRQENHSRHFLDISSDGRLLVTAANKDQKAVVWFTDSLQRKGSTRVDRDVLHSITDVRFGPNRTILATSSLEKAVKIWEEYNPFPVCIFKGHTAEVASVDFHPLDEDIVCSQTVNNELKLWSIAACEDEKKHWKKQRKVYSGLMDINEGALCHTETGGSLVRFQPPRGDVVAAVRFNTVALFEVSSGCLRGTIECKSSDRIISISWDHSGEHLVTLTGSAVNAWKITQSTGNPKCVGTLILKDLEDDQGPFNSCCFHPTNEYLVLIGVGSIVKLWDRRGKKLGRPVDVQNASVSSLATSSDGRLAASCSVAGTVNLWGW